jgi:(E)-2-((N-methylformamido)methylene)succinate hydrolase
VPVVSLSISMHMDVRGEEGGRRAVFVHGVGSHLESWDGVTGRLGRGVRSLCYDLRGHGESEKAPGPYSMDQFVDDLRGLVQYLGWPRFDLVGFSLGGLIAQAYTLHYPEAVRSLTIISSVAGRTAEERERVASRARTLSTSGATTHLAEAVDRWFSDEFRAAHPEVVEARKLRSLNNDPLTYAAAYRVLAHSDFADQLHDIRCPALIMTGEHDVGSSPRMARLMAERIAGARLEILPRLRHSVLLEAPDQVGALIEGFFRDHPPT